MAKKKKYMPEVINKVIESGDHWETCPFDLEATPKHKGEDIINRTNEREASPDWIVAIEDGKVYKTGYGVKAGYYVYIQHINGYYSFYCHLEKGTILVKKNEKVKKGQRLGFMGQSGKATGKHLHLGILINLDVYEDPYPYLTGEKDFNVDFPAGNYKVLYKKYLRTSPEVANNKYKYKNLTPTGKKNCDNVGGYARTKVGIIMKFDKFQNDKKGNKWGRTTSGKDFVWICVKDNTGIQVEKVD